MDARLEAANAILERGVRFRLPAPFYKKWLKRDYVTIGYLRAGTILEISRVVTQSGIENAIALGDYEQLSKTIEPCARCIAIAILNDKKKIEKQAEKLTRKLMWQISAASLVEIFAKIAIMNRVSDFMNITKFFWTTTTTMMNPKNLGRTTGVKRPNGRPP